jgi:hypothetical protein
MIFAVIVGIGALLFGIFIRPLVVDYLGWPDGFVLYWVWAKIGEGGLAAEGVLFVFAGLMLFSIGVLRLWGRASVPVLVKKGGSGEVLLPQPGWTPVLGAIVSFGAGIAAAIAAVAAFGRGLDVGGVCLALIAGICVFDGLFSAIGWNRHNGLRLSPEGIRVFWRYHSSFVSWDSVECLKLMPRFRRVDVVIMATRTGDVKYSKRLPWMPMASAEEFGGVAVNTGQLCTSNQCLVDLLGLYQRSPSLRPELGNESGLARVESFVVNDNWERVLRGASGPDEVPGPAAPSE